MVFYNNFKEVITIPNYTYICENCGKIEVNLPVEDRNIEVCPKEDCDGEVKRIFTGHPGIKFKGDNFYSSK